MSTRILYYLVPAFLICLPLAVAGQNIISSLFLLCFLAAVFTNPRLRLACKEVSYDYRCYLFVALAYLSWMSLSGFLNTQNPDFELSKFVAGYLAWILLPFIAATLGKFDLRPSLHILKTTLFTVAIIWVGIVISQSLFGWRILDGKIAEDLLRPRGLYSHPLTLAYVGLIVYLGSDYIRFLSPDTHKLRTSLWTFSISGLMISILSQSRMTQICILAFAGLQILLRLSGKKRAVAFGVMIALLVGVAGTENSISSRFKKTFTQERFDRQSDYADDRLAFWHVHWEMVKDRPFLGHGPHIHTAYRAPYYEKLGMGDFKKKYEAHNTFLQILTGGGSIGLILFLTFCALQWKTATSRFQVAKKRQAYLTAGFIALASIAQNSLQDAEVRYTYTLLIATIAYLNTNNYFLKKNES